jgi:DNA ligase-1
MLEDVLPVLYHQGSHGKLYSWRVWTESNLLCVEYGTVDGEKSTSKKEISGKNIGKSHETTPQQQAMKEAVALWNKKKKGKYRETINETERPVFLPMLAHDWNKQKKLPEFPLDVQPKLNGVRCLAYWDEDGVHLMSRGGDPWFIPHIEEELNRYRLPGLVLDGELYVHDTSLQQIIHLVKNPELSEPVEYRVFDVLWPDDLELSWTERYQELEFMFDDSEYFKDSKINIVRARTVKSEQELYKILSQYERDGYEGIIVRTHQGKYKLGHRSRDLLKLKNFKDAEFKIVGWYEATGNDKGTVCWVCAIDNGDTFRVRPMGTRDERANLLRDAESYVGQFLTVKYQDLTDDGIPQFPVGIAIRDKRDL